MLEILSSPAIISKAKALFAEERAMTNLHGWFLVQESRRKHEGDTLNMSKEMRAAYLLARSLEELPLSVSDNAIFVGTQRDAFASSYALINPAFKVETFAGYCDPTEVYDYIQPTPEISAERIADMRAYAQQTDYVRALSAVYKEYEVQTAEVVFFFEQVTGHVIPDIRPILKGGVEAQIAQIDTRLKTEPDAERAENLRAMRLALESAVALAARYRSILERQLDAAGADDQPRIRKMIETLCRVPAHGARTLYEAIQSFILIWQIMCIEQAPNPFALSVGNADRIFEPYRAADALSREDAASLLTHLLVFFNVGDRSWAISQNLIVGGRDLAGADLTNETSYALLDAYYEMNLPQPILSAKLHRGTPEQLYRQMGRFFFTPGCLTPSLFNDDSLFCVLERSGVAPSDLPDYAVAGCQEPLIMGCDNGNTTNSWLNLGKILELTLNNGISAISGKYIGTHVEDMPPLEALQHIRERFYENTKAFVRQMCSAANGASRALSLLPVPFLSTLMGGIETGYDMRDTAHQGTKYNGSGCLIHGLSVVADSFTAIDRLLQERPEDAEALLLGVRNNFTGHEALQEYLRACPKYGMNEPVPDQNVVEIASRVSEIVRSVKNYLGNAFRPDFSTPSTHLLYGHWVGALPDGREACDMLNYGVDPFYGDANGGLGLRTLSTMKLPFETFCGGYASHFGIDAKCFNGKDLEEKGLQFYERVIAPLFFNPMQKGPSPFYLYVNVTTAEILRKVLANPKKYAPSGVYIMRIHGTFVNFLDLSPAIQDDIIRRLDPASTAISP